LKLSSETVTQEDFFEGGWEEGTDEAEQTIFFFLQNRGFKLLNTFNRQIICQTFLLFA